MYPKLTRVLVSQAVHDQYSENQDIKLTGWSAITGGICALFTFTVPHLHHLRIYSAISIVLIITFCTIAIAISIKDGALPDPARVLGCLLWCLGKKPHLQYLRAYSANSIVLINTFCATAVAIKDSGLPDSAHSCT